MGSTWRERGKVGQGEALKSRGAKRQPGARPAKVTQRKPAKVTQRQWGERRKDPERTRHNIRERGMLARATYNKDQMPPRW